MYTVRYSDIANMIDHSLLKPNLTDQDIKTGCGIAAEWGAASVCVRPSDVILAEKLLRHEPVVVSTVIGFPHGAHTTEIKLAECRQAIDQGAKELDAVINIGKMKSGDQNYVEDELHKMTAFIHAQDVKIKVIFENCYLTKEEIIALCEMCNRCGADWVKTSTGYGTSGATEDDIILMRQHALPAIQVKAAGGVRTLEKAIIMKTLGCTRIGATATVDILTPLLDTRS